MDEYNYIGMEYAIEDFYEAYSVANKPDKRNENIFKEYQAFSNFMHSAFLSSNSDILNSRDFTAVNKTILDKIYYKIRKHPIIWKIFFAVRG